MGRKEMESELRQLRLEKGAKPISKMKMLDIATEIERYKTARAETPASASVPSAPIKMSKSAIESVKEAKAQEFPVVPEGEKGEKVAKKNVKSKGGETTRPAPKEKVKPVSESKDKKIAKATGVKGMSKIEQLAKILGDD